MAETLRFVPESRLFRVDHKHFRLAVTFTEAPELWEPYVSPDGSIFAVAGRVGLDERHWQMGDKVPGPGGLAAKALWEIGRTQGIEEIERLGGNCILVRWDAGNRELNLWTDLAGAFPAFETEVRGGLVYASHPDFLARVSGRESDLDEVSLSEFLLSSTVTPPFTYYSGVRSVEPGLRISLAFPENAASVMRKTKYFDLSFRGEKETDQDQLAAELATALRDAVRRRTLPRLGKTAVALSGGMDSRVILSCVDDPERTIAFSCYNEPNRELRVAGQIARAVGVSFHPWQRPFEYYGETAELGVRVSGAMGTFANNHFLGIIPWLREVGAQNLLTGCYFDYLFKGLPLNRRAHWLTGREQLAPFQHEFYFSHHPRKSPLARQVRDRWESRVPPRFQAQDSPAAVFEVEARRTFPLCYEGDNQQRVVPQRLTGWSLPVADRKVMEVYRRIPWHFKLNRSIYTKAVRTLCTGRLARVPDANTGAPIGASLARECVSTTWIRTQRKLARFKPSLGTDGSWPNWHHYVAHSSKLSELWNRPCPRARDFFLRMLGPDDVRPHARDYAGPDTFLFVSLLTTKLWFEQWHN